MAFPPNASKLAAYRSTSVHSGVAAADPHRLVVMLMDGALERIGSARGAIEHGEANARNHLIARAVDILQELRASLNMEAGGDIAANMADLYDYASKQLVRANLQNKPELLDEAANLLRQIRSAWIQIPGLTAEKP